MQVKKRWMALDVGDKTVGVAVTDPMGWTVQPLTTVRRRDLPQTFGDLKALLLEYEVETLVLGLPLNTEGKEGPQAQKVRLFERQLKNFLKRERGMPIQWVLWDESLTTREAEEYLVPSGLSRKKRKKVVDALAAALILESYLAHCHEKKVS